VADLPQTIDRAIHMRVAAHIDREGKLPRALESLGPVGGREVVLVDADLGLRAHQLAGLGGRVTALERPDRLDDLSTAVGTGAGAAGITVATGSPAALGLADGSADVIVGCFSAYRGVDAAEQAEADRVLRPGGRLLVVHDYGRDDISAMTDPARPELRSWGRRDGPFLLAGFKVRVIHCWWTFDTLDEASELLGAAFGPAGSAVATELRRPRLSHNVAIYHRSRDDA
jgi:hypothetical protein